MAKTIDYALVLPEIDSDSSFDRLAKSYIDSVSYFIERSFELEGRVYRGVVEPQLGIGAGAKKNSGRQESSGSGTGNFGNRKIRGGYASSIKAIATRRAKFGASKLKAGTKQKLESKGFNIGAPTTVPRRSGQNKPKGSA